MLRAPHLILLLMSVLMWTAPSARASSDAPRGLDTLASIPVQDGGRVMPLETYARRLASQLTGRTHWGASRGPQAFAGRSAMQLLCDLMFRGSEMLRRDLIAVENKPFKRLVGLDPDRRFFTAVELAMNKGVNELLDAYSRARQQSADVQPTKDQRIALNIRDAVDRVAGFASNPTLAIVPGEPGKTYRSVGTGVGDPGTDQVRAALAALGKAYLDGGSIETEASALQSAIAAVGVPTQREARAVRLELFYDQHRPYLMTAVLYGLAIVLFGVSRLMFRRTITILALVSAAGGAAEHILAVGLRVAILGRAPVSNTYEALLWMGLVGIGLGLIAQALNRKGWYLFAGVCAAFISVLFAGMVPLGDQTNSIPAVLRSNFWLTIHVLTIVASYGVLAVASVLGHVYLAKEVLFARKDKVPSGVIRRSAPLIVQTYRSIQVGLVLLTAGTMLGGVWAADSWGRFWGWDPKETWALISIITYFAVLHARYVRWLLDFGLAAAAVLGFVVIVWTFYGVNYVMATGLHSYGFGSGGEVWVGVWALAEIAFLIACRIRVVALRRRAAAPIASSPRHALQG